MALSARAADPGPADLSLEDLLKTEIVTVSRKPEALQATAAAAFVITREDIERSGVTSIPEALRMAPGVQVARIANNRWAVTVRGFNGRFANKLLVLVDGRSIYSPLFAGVLWEFEDTLLEDVERIEVIRGPGAAIWGANAVNGVINIITRKARDTQGDLVAASAGSKEAFGAARHGGEAADGYYRVWAKAFSRAPSVDLTGVQGNDSWRAGRVGFRRDWAAGTDRRWMLSGEAYGGPTGDRWNIADLASPQGYTPTDITEKGSGAHLLGRGEWTSAEGTVSALQSYLDYQDINVENEIQQTRTTVDIDFQRHAPVTAGNDFVWGLGYRFSKDDVQSQGIFSFVPERSSANLASAFLQDDYALVPDKLRLIAGARVEHNSYTGWELQPNLRTIWTPTPNQSFWAAVSRAVRTPTRADENAQVDLTVTPASPPQVPLPVLTRNIPAPSGRIRSEKVRTLEVGYRQQLDAALSLDLTAFLSAYQDLRSAQLASQQVILTGIPHIEEDINPVNAVQAHTRGVELSVDWRPVPGWRLQPSYSYLHIHAATSSTDPLVQFDAAGVGGSAPLQEWTLRSAWTPSSRQQWDLWLRHVGALENADESGTVIAAYTTLDARAAWRPRPALELSVVGQNLLQARHAEFVPDLLPSVTLQVQRSFYIKAKYQF